MTIDEAFEWAKCRKEHYEMQEETQYQAKALGVIIFLAESMYKWIHEKPKNEKYKDVLFEKDEKLKDAIHFQQMLADNTDNLINSLLNKSGKWREIEMYTKWKEENLQYVEWLKELEISRKHLNYILYCMGTFEDNESLFYEVMAEMARYESEVDDLKDGDNIIEDDE
jgi:hypothetical protein